MKAIHFWSRISPEPNTGCWLWVGSSLQSGYGRMRSKRAHRWSWEIHHGPVPSELSVLHKCDVRVCVNPDHLFIGTQADNVADCRAKGRARYPGGRNQPCGDNHWSRVRPERLARGARNGARLHPESLARGDRNGARLHPETRARGDRNGSRLRPETRPRGEANGLAKLSENDVRQIRARSASGESRAVLQKAFGTCRTNIDNIINRTTWRHVP